MAQAQSGSFDDDIHIRQEQLVQNDLLYKIYDHYATAVFEVLGYIRELTCKKRTEVL